MKEDIRSRFDDVSGAICRTRDRLTDRIAEAVDLIVACYHEDHGVLVFGNGGSASDAQHIAGELVGRFLRERRALKAEALSTNTSILTALANDYDFEMIFARQIEANGRAGDVAIGITTSGNSANVVAGLRKAHEIGLKTIALTGEGGGKCADHADVLLDVPATHTPRIQEAHIAVYHIICELVERAVVGMD